MRVRDLGNEPAGDSGLTVRQMLAADIASSMASGVCSGGDYKSGAGWLDDDQQDVIVMRANKLADALLESWKETR